MRTTVTAIATLILLSSVHALGRDLDQDEALRLNRSGQILPLESILLEVRKHYPDAQLLEVELDEHHDNYTYDVELLTKAGQARELEMDARTGKLLQDKEDD